MRDMNFNIEQNQLVTSVSLFQGLVGEKEPTADYVRR